MNHRELFTFTCMREGESTKALLVVDPPTGEQIWIPFSQIESMHFNETGDGYVVMTAWIAKQKGLL